MLISKTITPVIENIIGANAKSAARGARFFRSSFAKGLEIVDIFAIALLVAISLRLYTADRLLSASLAITMPMAIAAIGLWWVMRENNLYYFEQIPKPFRHFMRTIGASSIALFSNSIFALMISGITARPWIECVSEALFITAISGAILAIIHFLGAYLVGYLQRAGAFSMNVVIVGATEQAKKLINHPKSQGDINFLGIFDDRIDRAPNEISNVQVLGDLDALMNWDMLPSVDRVVITVSSAAQKRVLQLVEKLRSMPNKLVLAIDMHGFDADGTTIGRLGAMPVAYVSGTPEDARRAFWKRVQDLVISTIAFVLLSPIFIITAIAIKLESKGPVFFRQPRHGFNNQSFLCWKFRSMREDMSDFKAEQQVTKDDPRVTKVGKFIRKTSIDELPQLFNVFAGEMSLVGPRPHAIGMKTGNVKSEKLVSDYAHRHRIKPGITGWAAIHGSRGPVHTPQEVSERVQLDTEYIDNSNFWMDLYIIFMTIPSLLGDKAKIR
jgi:polysaccharide biosynthesis protein PslA